MAKFKLTNPVHFLALGFGSGLIRPAPGTWGTLAAVILYFVVLSLFINDLAIYLGVTLFAFVIGIYLCGKTASDVGEHDHSAIVWDEFVGFFVTMTAIQPTLLNIVLGFCLFRLFDILKPFPIGWFDKKVHGGLGIMIDDVIAGLFACVLLHLLQQLI